MAKDYYKILGVSRAAGPDEIKRAYRKLAHQYHPDKKGGDEGKFKEISEAYRVLSDGQKKAQYDRFGATDFAGGFDPGAAGFGFGAQGGGVNWDFSGLGFDPENLEGFGDIFETFFGGARRRTYTRGADIEVTVAITLEEAFNGLKKKIEYTTFRNCEGCNGLGYFEKEGTTTCKACGGKGEIKEARQTFFGNFAQVRACEKCAGTGQIPNKVCSSCRGQGRITGKKTVTLDIAPGIQSGQIIKILKAGEAGERGAAAGDLYARIQVLPHRVFGRNIDNLFIQKEVSLVDILLGKEIELPTIAGKNVRVTIPGGFKLKDKLKISHQGMPRFGRTGYGDLIVEFDVRTPKKISKRAKELLDELRGELE